METKDTNHMKIQKCTKHIIKTRIHSDSNYCNTNTFIYEENAFNSDAKIEAKV